MTNTASAGGKIDRLIETDPIRAGEYHIQPVVRLIGWATEGHANPGSYVGKVGRLTPIEARIGNGETKESVAIDDPVVEPLRGMLIISTFVSAICLLIMLAANVAAIRK